MADELGPAVVALQRKLDEQLQAIADTKRTINMLLKMSGRDALYPDNDGERSGAVRADQFYGKGLTISSAEYLTMRQQACQADEIYRALKAGGFDFEFQGWQGGDRDMVRNLAMSLSKNTGQQTKKFHRLKNGSFGLRSWYDPDFLKKAAEGAEAPTKPKKKKAQKKKAAPIQTTDPVKAPPKDKKSRAKAEGNKPELVKPKSSAKSKDRPVADRTVAS